MRRFFLERNNFTPFCTTALGFLPGPMMDRAHIIPGGAMWEHRVDNVKQCKTEQLPTL